MAVLSSFWLSFGQPAFFRLAIHQNSSIIDTSIIAQMVLEILKRWAAWILESAAIVLGLFISILCAFLSPIIPLFRIFDSVSVLLLGFVLLWLLGRGIIALIRRKWLGAVLRIVAIPFLFLAAILACVAAGMMGEILIEQDWNTATLPVEKSALKKLTSEGRAIAATLAEKTLDGKPMELKAIEFDIDFRGEIPTHRIRYDFATASNFFRISGEYSQQGNHWQLTRHHCSGDTETFRANERVLVPALPAELFAPLDWPLQESVVFQFADIGRAICKVFDNEQPLPTEGALWNLENIRFQHGLSKGLSDSIDIDLVVRNGKLRPAYASIELRYDGKKARFNRCYAGVSSGSSDSSTMDHEVAVKTVLREWLSEDRGILEKMHDQGKPWRKCEALLPNNIRMIYYEQPAHPFLAEYNMRVEFILPDGSHRLFELPMNTGGRTSVLAYTGRTNSGSEAVHLVSGPHFNLGFDLRTLRIIDPKLVLGEIYVGAFLEEKTPLGWFPSAK